MNDTKIIETLSGIEFQSKNVKFEDNNIEDSILKVVQYGLKHISIKSRSIEFLEDPRLSNITGVNLVCTVENIQPLTKLNQLRSLFFGFSEEIKNQIDFALFPNLEYLSGRIPKKNYNLSSLTKLLNVSIRNFQEEDLQVFSKCTELNELEIYSGRCTSLKGIDNCLKLEKVILEKFPKLTNLNGLGSQHTSLNLLTIRNCKLLSNTNPIGNVHNLKKLNIAKVGELDSLRFLDNLDTLEFLYLHPAVTKVRNQDYYPLVSRFKKMNNIEQLSEWKDLNKYLNNEIKITDGSIKEVGQLEQLQKSLPFLSWEDNQESGPSQYSADNCLKAQNIFVNLINELERNSSSDKYQKLKLFEKSVLQLNNLNDELDRKFIETSEREEICDVLDNIAEAVGIDTDQFEGGIADKWRNW